jgi:hypothetical protein
MKKYCSILALAILVVGGCSEKSSKIEIRYENGVKTVINPILSKAQMAKVPWLGYVKEFSIDSENPELEKIGLTDIIGFGVRGDGTIVVLTARGLDEFVHIFDANGKYSASFGRRGQGPGELQDPKYIDVGQSAINILDFGRKKLVSYAGDGSFLSESSIPPNIRRITVLSNGNAVVLRGQPDPNKGEIDFPVSLCDGQYQTIKELSEGRSMPIFAQSASINGLNLRIDYEVWQVFGERVYVGSPFSGYDIFVYDQRGELLEKICKGFRPVQVSREYRNRIADWMGRNASEFASKLVFPASFPAFQYFFLDDQGQIFVMTYEEADGAGSFFYDVYDADGSFIARTNFDNTGILPSSPLRVPVPLQVVVKNDHVFYLREKENGFKELVVSRWKQ